MISDNLLKELNRIVAYYRRLSKIYFLRFKATEHVFVMIVAIAIGVVGGLGAVGIQSAIKFFQKIFWGDWNLPLSYFTSLPWTHKVIAPAIGGLLVGLVIHFISKESKGHGVPEVMEAIALRSGVIRPRVAIAKLVASSLYIGAGGSVGREGPVIQIGSSIGSTLGQFFKVNSRRMKTFVACGAAAGIAAAFNAPLAGALFSLEIILGEFAVAHFSPIVVSSVVATAVSRHFLGDFPAFPVPLYKLVNPTELVFYGVLGLMAGFVALLFINALHTTEVLFDKMRGPIYLKTLLGGLLIGSLGAVVPNIYGVGYFTIEAALRGELWWQWLLLLIFLKVIATSISLGSGGSGGVFAPALFLGAMTGGFFGEIVHGLFPDLTASSGAYALVGMAAVVAAATHAPITGILIIFEMTNDYKIILPLMISSIVATLLSTKLQKESIYTIKLVRRGIDLFRGQEMNVLRSIHVRDIMKSKVNAVPMNMPLHDLMAVMLEKPQSQFFVTNPHGGFEGVISLTTLRDAIHDEQHLSKLLVAYDLMDSNVPLLYADDTLDHAMKLFGSYEAECLAVLRNHGEQRLVAKLDRQSVIEAYNEEIGKRDVANELVRSVKVLDQVKTVDFVDGYQLAKINCPREFAGKTLRELDLRADYETQVVLIERAGGKDSDNDVVPAPDYVMQVSDSLVVVGPEKKVKMLTNL